MNKLSTKERYEIDWDKIKDWRTDDELSLPILSMISFYKATGIFQKIESEQKPISPIDCLSANLNTLEKIKQLIKHNWQYYNVRLKSSNNIEWKEEKGKQERRDPLTLSSKVEKSLIYDFVSYCPALDPSLEDNVVILDTTNLEKSSLKEEKEN